MTRCDAAAAFVCGNVEIIFKLCERLRQIGCEGLVEIEAAFIHQLQHHVSEGGLGERGAIHDRVGLERFFALHIAIAISGDMLDLAILDQGERHAFDVFARHQRFDLFVNCGRGQTLIR